MRFSPLLVSNILIWPLRYFFSHYAGDNLKYNTDEKINQIEIGAVNDFHKIPLQLKPRILVNRGNYMITNSGLTDNLAEAKTMRETKGLRDNKNLILIRGQAQIIVEARNEGTIELITDMVTHFLVWSKPFICDSQGFKDFAIPLNVASPTQDKEDKEKFQVTITVPYLMEESWATKNDAMKLNEFYMTFITA